MLFTSRRRVLVLFGPLAIAAACGLSAIAACNPLFFLPRFHEGPHHVVPTTAADSQRVRTVQACLTSWARSYFGDRGSNHFNDSLTRVVYDDSVRLVIVRVDGDGIIAMRGRTQWQVDAAEKGDTILLSHWVTDPVAYIYHEAVHLPQSRHPELIGAAGDIHWAPPWDYCHVRRAIFSSG